MPHDGFGMSEGMDSMQLHAACSMLHTCFRWLRLWSIIVSPKWSPLHRLLSELCSDESTASRSLGPGKLELCQATREDEACGLGGQSQRLGFPPLMITSVIPSHLQCTHVSCSSMNADPPPADPPPPQNPEPLPHPAEAELYHPLCLICHTPVRRSRRMHRLMRRAHEVHLYCWARWKSHHRVEIGGG